MLCVCVSQRQNSLNCLSYSAKHEIPVVGHQHESHNAHGTLVLHFGQHTDKGIVVAGFLQQGQAGYGTVEDVVDDAARGLPAVRDMTRW